jgi:hypothetical protein
VRAFLGALRERRARFIIRQRKGKDRKSNRLRASSDARMVRLSVD